MPAPALQSDPFQDRRHRAGCRTSCADSSGRRLRQPCLASPSQCLRSCLHRPSTLGLEHDDDSKCGSTSVMKDQLSKRERRREREREREREMGIGRYRSNDSPPDQPLLLHPPPPPLNHAPPPLPTSPPMCSGPSQCPQTHAHSGLLRVRLITDHRARGSNRTALSTPLQRRRRWTGSYECDDVTSSMHVSRKREK